MHDPMTLAFTIPNPFTRRKFEWSPDPYYSPLIEVWHVDPERRGDDDSCDWHGFRSITDEERAWCHKEGRKEWAYMIRGVEKSDEPGYWPGGMINASALELLYAVWSIILWRYPFDGRPAYRRRFGGPLHGRALAASVPSLLAMVGNSTDNLHSLISRARAHDDDGQRAMGELFAAVFRIMRGKSRPWWRHPRFHVHHWSIRVVPWQNLTRWLTRRCHKCGRRFAWGEAPLFDSHGYSHINGCNPGPMRNPAAKVA